MSCCRFQAIASANSVRVRLIDAAAGCLRTTSTDPADVAQIKAKTQDRIGAMLQQLDDQLAANGGPWMMGEKFSALDIYAFMLGRWTRMFDGAPPATQPAGTWANLGPFMHRMLSRPAVQRVVAKQGLKEPVIQVLCLTAFS